MERVQANRISPRAARAPHETSDASSLAVVQVSRLQMPLGEAVDELPRLAERMGEAERMCSHVVTRFSRIYMALLTADTTSTTTASSSTLSKFAWQVFRFHDFLTRYADKKLITRLVCGRKIVEKTSSVQRELDAVAVGLRDVCAADLREDWMPQWREDRRVLREGWEALHQDGSRLAMELLDTASQIEAMVLLKCEKETYWAKYSPEELQLLNVVFGYAASLSRAEVPHVPRWFVPPHEVEFNEMPFSKGAFGSVHHGTWLDARVVVKLLLAPIDDEQTRVAFMKESNIWFELSHPHVVKLHGACHVGKPFFVCEFASHGILTDFLLQEENAGRHMLWQKVYEVGLGLHYLHERNVTHGDLKSNNILVGADGKAKLTDFGLSFVLTSSAEPEPLEIVGAQRWKAPEVLQGTSGPSFAADIYSFGMSIIEAATHELPWGNELPDGAVRYHVVKMRVLPPQPECLSDEQWELIQQMCAFEPSDRLMMPAVLEKLKEFSDREFNEGISPFLPSANVAVSSTSTTPSQASSSMTMSSTSTSISVASETQSMVLSQVMPTEARAMYESSGGRSLVSSIGSTTSISDGDVESALGLQQYLAMLVDFTDGLCESIDDVCREAQQERPPEPEEFLARRYDERMRELQLVWMERHHVTQEKLMTSMLVYEHNAELQTTRASLLRRLQEHASEAVRVFDGEVDPAKVF